ncbi:class I SAM-dependent methyltransferase [Wolinella succinogenes]|uniref:class I SAM-dependent methyltransferase n=1 Tax=Wolinella succinogenes TaxID=844 RepID=UPI002FC628AE
MHYYIYPKGAFGQEIATLLDYLSSLEGEVKYSYEFIDDFDPSISLELLLARGLGNGEIMVASEKFFHQLVNNLLLHGIKDYVNGIEFHDKKMKEIASKGVAGYWSAHMIASNNFETAEESLKFFEHCNDLYVDYRKYISVSGLDGKVVLDYGCGPGNEMTGILTRSTPKRLIGADVSAPAIERAKKRIALHGKTAEFLLIDEKTNRIDLEDNSVDYINCPGVLMNVSDLDAVLKEFYRVLKPKGRASIMVYHYDSIWLHLYAAYIFPMENPKYRGMRALDVYKYTTDGEHCPVSTCFKTDDFVATMERHGFKGGLQGVAISVDELMWLPRRFEAIKDRNLDKEHREFLSNLTFDNRGIPYYRGHVAGNDGCYLFEKL